MRGLPLAVLLLAVSPSMAASAPEPPGPDATVVRAHVAVQSLRLTDNGDSDGFADPNETVSVYVTLRNGSGAARDGIVIRLLSTDPAVACIPTPVVAFGALAAGESREGTIPLAFRVADDVARVDPFQDLTAALEFVISGDDFDSTRHAQQATLDLDLNVSGGLLPSTFTEGFESTTFGAFTSMSLDAGIETLERSDGYRCQYNDPDSPNSNDPDRPTCFLGAANPADNAFDWHLHGTASTDGGRAFLGNQSLHWGMHIAGGPTMDTTRLRQLDAIRTTLPINLGWNGVVPELSFKHQASLIPWESGAGSFGEAVDRGIVQIQLADSAGAGVGNWRKIHPYENVYDVPGTSNFTNCMFDPVDDGSDEDDYFDPSDPDRRLGPSSTCSPEFVFSYLGSTDLDPIFDPEDIGHASDGPGLQGALGPGTWVESKFDLQRFRGRRLRLRFLVTSIEVGNAVSMQQALGWAPVQWDDGWYLDDVRVTNTLVSQATVSVDTADRSGLPACGPGCTSASASLTATPETVGLDEEVTLDASGSVVDPCPGEVLFRFWITGNETLGDQGDFLLQDWSENAVIMHQRNFTTRYGVEVACSTLPACQDATTVLVPFACTSIEPRPFPHSIRFDSPFVLSWGTTTEHDAIRGDLTALRASGGDFADTVEICLRNDFSEGSLFDASAPAPGQGSYYLVRRAGTASLCTFHSWTSGSASEVPAAGGNRDEDIALDPDTCP